MKKIIIRDFDGPIIDSKNACFHFMSDFWGFQINDIIQLFDGNFFEQFRLFLNRSMQKKEVTIMKKYYTDRIDEMHLVTGINDLIAFFNAKGYRQYIVSSNVCDISLILRKFGIVEFFVDVLDGNKERSKVKKFHMVHEKEGGAISDYFFITDTVGDIKEAIEAGISPDHIFAVTWGYHDGNRLAKIEGIQLVDDVRELLHILK